MPSNKKCGTMEFVVQAKLDILASVTVSARSLEDATTQAMTLTYDDFVSVNDELIDSGLRVTGVYEA